MLDPYAEHTRVQRGIMANPRVHRNTAEMRVNKLKIEVHCPLEQVAALSWPRGATYTIVAVVTRTGKRYKAALKTSTIQKAQEVMETHQGHVSIVLVASLDGGDHLMDAGLIAKLCPVGFEGPVDPETL